jgi:SNF2 family DNA or RNA helicase
LRRFVNRRAGELNRYVSNDKLCCTSLLTTPQYHGKLSLNARDKAIKEFASNARSTVLLASLRCGGLGLNLTMASKVIIIDPWWNQASEQQAFCRVFRIGQQDETFMSRMCVKNTVDERLIEMQKEKQKEIDEVMEDRGKKTRQ